MFIGIDLGTSGVKAVAVRDGDVLATRTIALAMQSPNPGWSEQNPADWWRAICDAVQGLAASGIDLGTTHAVGLSGQMHGAVLLDAADKVLRPAILWNDNRSIRECAEMEAAFESLGTVAGIRPLPGFTAPKLAWVKRHEPECYRKIAAVLLPKDYIGLRLHGTRVTDHSDAAGTLWYDQQNRSWHHGLCAASATDPQWMPPLLHGFDIAGHIHNRAANETGLPQGTPVVAGAGDAAAGALALGANNPGRGFISLGTSGQLFVANTAYCPNPAQFVHAFAHTLPERWYQMAAMLNGARPISWLAGQLEITPAEVTRLAQGANAEQVPLFLPYLTGERSPHGDPNIRGAFYGLEDSTDRPALCRAVVEAIAFSFADAADSFGQKSLEQVALTAIGGGSRSDFLLRLIATLIDRPIGRSAGADVGPALGASRLAAVGANMLLPAELNEAPVNDVCFDPERGNNAVFARRSQFQRLYKLLRQLDGSPKA